MKRKLKESEREIAEEIIKYLYRVDRNVFPRKPIKKIFILRGGPIEKSAIISYIPKEGDPDEGEYYRVWGYGLDRKIQNEIKGGKIILLKDISRYECWRDLPDLTPEELFIGIATHEVRHRLQCRRRIKLFSPKEIKRIKDPYFKRLIEFVKSTFKETPPKRNYREEFDAHLIENLIREEWHWGERDFSKIASLVKLEPKQLA